MEEINMGFLDKITSMANKATDAIDKGVKSVSDSSKKMAEKSKLKREISQNQAEINKFVNQLGQKCFELNKDDPSDEYAELIYGIKEKQERIKELDQEIKRIDERATCPKCGKVVEKGTKFCIECGENVEGLFNEPKTEQPVMKVCTKCGANLSEDQKFCEKCGEPVAPSEPVSNAIPTPTETSAENEAAAEPIVNAIPVPVEAEPVVNAIPVPLETDSDEKNEQELAEAVIEAENVNEE